jgi:peptidyl-prolyl cis-trans isomerase C
VPKARVDALISQATKRGQPRTPELEKQRRDEVVMREMFMQEAEKRGLAARPTTRRRWSSRARPS